MRCRSSFIVARLSSGGTIPGATFVTLRECRVADDVPVVVRVRVRRVVILVHQRLRKDACPNPRSSMLESGLL